MTLNIFFRCLGIVILGLLIYGQTFHFDFVFDDYIFIVSNPFIKNFSNFHLMWHVFPITRFVGMYSFALNYYFCQFHPAGYHIFNFLVHLIAVFLVWALADLLFKIAKVLPSQSATTQELPYIIALIFLVHPGQTQAVTYVTQRFESMATVFYLATIYFYIRGRLSAEQRQRIVLWALAFISAALGILTKEVFVTIPVMILASEWILFKNKDIKKILIFFAIGGVLLYFIFSHMVHANLGIFLQAVNSESHDGDIISPWHYVLTQMRVFLTFLRLLVFPIHQNLDYDYPASHGLLQPPLTLVGLTVITLICYLIVRLRREYPLIAFGLAWMLITFSINLAPRSNVIFEHKLYLISFGFFLSFVLALSLLIKNRQSLLKILGCILVTLSILAFERNKIWINELSLWEDSIKTSPHKARVNASLGRVYGNLGRLDDSIKYLSRSIAIKPDNITYENLGVIYSEEGKMSRALENLNKSINLDPKYFLTYVKRAWVFYQLHDLKSAMMDLAQAIALEPYFPDAYIERGLIWAQVGNNEGALKDFKQALRIDPMNFDTLIKLGAVYYSMGHYQEALEDFSKAQFLEPSSAEVSQYKTYCLTKLARSS